MCTYMVHASVYMNIIYKSKFYNVGLVSLFNGTSTVAGYLMPKLSY